MPAKIFLSMFLFVLFSANAMAEKLETNINVFPRQRSAAALEKTKPVIVITSPDVKRNVKLTAKEARVKVAGKATDTSGIAEVTVNGQPASLDEQGNFSSEALLKVGKNEIVVTAVNTLKNQSTERFAIVREPVKFAPAKRETVPATLPASGASTGRFFALVIGNNDYQHIRKLKTAVADAGEVAGILREEYGFETELLLNATRRQTLSSLNKYRKILAADDSLLVYYAGHGEFDQAAGKAYWLPVDAQREEDTQWIIADDITSNIKRFSSRHVLIVSDSCYSGTIDRGTDTDISRAGNREEFMKKMLTRPSRTLMASGGNEPVSDAGGGTHSIFADSFIKALKQIELHAFTADELFHQFVLSKVAGRSDQVPEYKYLRNSGHEGGDFIFLKKK